MNEPINDGGPAFPTPDVMNVNGYLVQYGGSGMSLRDWFAGMALQQFVAQRDHNIWAHEQWEASSREIALAAYNIADAMLAAREKGTK